MPGASGTITIDRGDAGAGLHVVLDTGSPRSEPSAALVAGFDMQPQSRAALEVAARVATQLRAYLYVIHVVDLADYPIDPDIPDWEEEARRTLQSEREMVAAALAGHATGWSYQTWRGDPARALLTAADQHDATMIVVGTRGQGWRQSVERLLAPSVSHQVVRLGRRPVLLVGQGWHPPR